MYNSYQAVEIWQRRLRRAQPKDGAGRRSSGANEKLSAVREAVPVGLDKAQQQEGNLSQGKVSQVNAAIDAMRTK